MKADRDSENESEKASNAIALAVLTVVYVLPITLLVLLGCKVSLWNTENFKARYGTILEGTDFSINVNYRHSLLLVKFFHLFRRGVFVANLLLLENHLWAQIAIQLVLSSTMTLLLVKFKPLESRF